MTNDDPARTFPPLRTFSFDEADQPRPALDLESARLLAAVDENALKAGYGVSAADIAAAAEPLGADEQRLVDISLDIQSGGRRRRG